MQRRGWMLGALSSAIGIAACLAGPVVAQPSGADSAAADVPTYRPRPAYPDSELVGRGMPVTRFGSHLSAYPYAYYTPETQLAFGAGGIFTFYTAREKGLRPSKVTLSAYYSTNDQYKFTLSPDVFFNRNRLFTEMDVDYGRYVDRYYGMGPETPDVEQSEYNLRGWGFRAEIQLPPRLHVFNRTRAGFRYEIRQRTITDTRGNPNLQDPAPRGIDGGFVSGLGWVWVWDSRDRLFYPRSGVFSRLSGDYYMQAIGSDYDFIKYKADIRSYRMMGPDFVFALNLLGEWTGGYPPFYMLSALGGSQMHRGYFSGRYRDKLYLAGQVELRRHLFWRIGAVGFACAGAVAPDLSELRIRTLLVSGGAGLRFLFNRDEEVNLRVDLGFGKNSNGLYFGLEEAF